MMRAAGRNIVVKVLLGCVVSLIWCDAASSAGLCSSSTADQCRVSALQCINKCAPAITNDEETKTLNVECRSGCIRNAFKLCRDKYGCDYQ